MHQITVTFDSAPGADAALAQLESFGLRDDQISLAAIHEDALWNGGILMAVRADGTRQKEEIEKILNDSGGQRLFH